MQIIIPMSGIGKRFLDAGYNRPKPLILVDGIPIIKHVASMFPGEHEFLFVCNNAHLKETEMEKVINDIEVNKNIIGISPHRLGPVHAIMKAEGYIRNGDPAVVSYADFSMAWDFSNFIETVSSSSIDSASACYRGFHPHLRHNHLYAGVRTNDELHALEVREKYAFTPNPMDTWQQAGVYYFSSGSILKEYSKAVIDAGLNHNGEHYMSHLFNPLIEAGLSSLVYPIKYFCQWGTPQDLEEYEAWSRYFASKSGAEKGRTEIPTERERFVKITPSIGENDYEKTYEYWDGYLSSCDSHPYTGSVK